MKKQIILYSLLSTILLPKQVFANPNAAIDNAKLKITLAEQKATDQQRIETAFRRCVSRHPSPSESQLLTRFLTKQRSYFADHSEEAKQISATKKSTETTTADFAAWVALSRVLLNMDETITKE